MGMVTPETPELCIPICIFLSGGRAMSTCKACGKELTEKDFDNCCDSFLCFEQIYCHQPEVIEFEPILIDPLVLAAVT